MGDISHITTSAQEVQQKKPGHFFLEPCFVADIFKRFWASQAPPEARCV
jgi:hypothetical protein